jgi:coenzyme F420-reducing hydrogenase delta subunit
VQGDLVLAAFEGGADGVLLVGCEEGNCHHQGGNMRAVQRLAAIKSLLANTGIGSDRLAFWQGGLGQPTAFVERLHSFVADIAAMGASPLKPSISASGGKSGD